MEIVTGVFESRNNAEKTVRDLRSLGIQESRIGFLAPGTADGTPEAGVPVTDTEEPGMGRAMGAAVGGGMGAAGGAALGLAVASLAVPGIGPLIAFGMLGGGLLGAIGAAAGAAIGDTVEEELGEGIPHEDLYIYEDALRRGKSVVIAYPDEGEQAEKAADVLNVNGAEDMETVRENWWQELRDEERSSYRGGHFDHDEESYRRGYQAALHPKRRGKAYTDVEDELRTAYAGLTLDRPFRDGYERGSAHRPRGVENR
jgi:hypothetical protein